MIAIYPGSFNPYHQGHKDILDKALKVFDKIIVARGINPTKGSDRLEYENEKLENKYEECLIAQVNNSSTIVTHYHTLLVDFVKEANKKYGKISAIIRGLRNGSDLQYEMNLQYWNEDLGLVIPVMYFVTDRKYCHISSSAISQIEQF